MKIIGAVLSLLLFTLSPQTARAGTDATYFSIRLGKPFLNVALDPNLQPALGAGVAFGLEAFKPFNSLPIAVGVFMQPLIGGRFGGMPVLQAGASIYYFPFARLESSYVVDDEVAVRTTSWVPYIKFQPGFEFLNFRDDTDGATFGASSLMYILSAGVMAPLNQTMRWGGELSYTTTMGAKDQHQAPISVSGLMISANITFFLP